jgi:hypothetical protein
VVFNLLIGKIFTMLSIVKHIKLHGLEATVDKFKLKMRDYGHKIHLKYNQLESNYNFQEVQECRGLILDSKTFNVISLSFFKFFNIQEAHAHAIDWDSAIFYKKLDGCLEENIILITEEGEKTIKEICETKFFGKVQSFDIESNKIVFDEIVGHSIKKNINNWFEIELEDGSIIKLTANHRVWLPNLKCYRAVSDLMPDDEFLVIP